MIDTDIEKRFIELTNEYKTDVFMTPGLYFGNLVILEDIGFINEDHFDISDYPDIDKDQIEHYDNVYYVQASADGYLDQSEIDIINDIDDLNRWFELMYEPLEGY